MDTSIPNMLMHQRVVNVGTDRFLKPVRVSHCIMYIYRQSGYFISVTL